MGQTMKGGGWSGVEDISRASGASETSRGVPSAGKYKGSNLLQENVRGT